MKSLLLSLSPEYRGPENFQPLEIKCSPIKSTTTLKGLTLIRFTYSSPVSTYIAEDHSEAWKTFEDRNYLLRSKLVKSPAVYKL